MYQQGEGDELAESLTYNSFQLIGAMMYLSLFFVAESSPDLLTRLFM